jgi:hypothetical protein
MTAGLFRKRGHSRATPAFRDRLAHCVVSDEGKIEWVVEWTRSTKPSVHTVTAGAVLSVELLEVINLSRRSPAFSFSWLTG